MYPDNRRPWNFSALIEELEDLFNYGNPAVGYLNYHPVVFFEAKYGVFRQFFQIESSLHVAKIRK
jgi:hypothetical protein